MITSSHNQKIQEIRLLRQAKHRRDRREYFVEGIRLVEEALREPAMIRQVAFSPRLEKTARGAALLALARQTLARAEWLHLGDEAMASLSETQTHQGILAVLRQREQSWDDIWKKPGLLLLLHELQDPGNLGMIFRVAEGAGAAAIVLSEGTIDPHNPKAVRASMGSLFRLPFLTGQKTEDCIAKVRGKGVRVLAAVPGGKRSLWDLDFLSPAAVLIGQEGAGLPPSLAAAADETFAIPMVPGAESLNAAMAAGLVVYEAFRQKSAPAKTPERF